MVWKGLWLVLLFSSKLYVHVFVMIWMFWGHTWIGIVAGMANHVCGIQSNKSEWAAELIGNTNFHEND
jgi:hypothetical protein